MKSRWRLALGLGWLLLVMAGLWQLRLDVQVLNLLPGDLPSVHALKLYEDHFANANELVISLQGLPPDGLEEAARKLALELRQQTNLVAQAVWTPPWMEHPEQMADFSAYLWLNQPRKEVDTLAARLAGTNLPALLEETKQQLTVSLSPDEIARLSYDPFGLLQVPGQEAGAPGLGNGSALFASAQGDFRILFVHARHKLGSYRENQVWLEQLKEIIAEWKGATPGYESLKLRFTGRPAFVSEISGSMEWDISTSVGGTLVIISGLFWFMHRRWKPLVWLVTLLMVILLTTLAIGGLIFHSLNVISLGFAAILLGLSVDYGLVLYQEWLASGTATKAEVRRAVAPSIAWAACTTSGAFVFLNLGGLPGLAQLGTLVAIGVIISATVMVSFYIIPFKTKLQPASSFEENGRRSRGSILFLGATVLIVAGGALLLAFSPPRMDVSSDPLRPAHSPAYAAVEEIKLRMERPDDPLWLVGTGTSYDDLARRFERAAGALKKAEAAGQIARATTPEDLIPRPERQQPSREVLGRLAGREEEFIQAATRAGFTESAVGLLKTMFANWRSAVSAPLPLLPKAEAGKWIIERFLSLDPGTFFALGMVHPSAQTHDPASRLTLVQELAEAGVILTGWELLGSEVFAVVKEKLWLIFGLMGVLVLACLSLAFRRVLPVLLSLSSVIVSGFLLLLIMWMSGWDWNLMNLMAIPLLVGAGLDYSIHVQLALDRHHGSVSEMRASIGRALSLCAATTFTGFGSLAWAGNPGLGSLGKVCAAGIASAYLVAVWLLPAWRTLLLKQATPALEK